MASKTKGRLGATCKIDDDCDDFVCSNGACGLIPEGGKCNPRSPTNNCFVGLMCNSSNVCAQLQKLNGPCKTDKDCLRSLQCDEKSLSCKPPPETSNNKVSIILTVVLIICLLLAVLGYFFYIRKRNNK